MAGEFRTRIADNVTLRAEIGGKYILLSEDHIRALGGILQGDLAGAAPELRYLFDEGILEFGAARPPAPEKLTALLPGDADSTLYLDPCTDIRVSLVGEGIENPITASQLYSAFIPPRQAAALVRLARRLRAAGKAMHRNEATRNMPVQMADWLRVLKSTYRESTERPELAEFMRIVPDAERHFRLEMNEPLQRNECTWAEARVRIHRAGTAEAARISVPIASRDLPTIATLLRSLCTGVRRSELLALPEESTEGVALARVVDALARSRAFRVVAQERPDWDALLPDTAMLSALHLGHAGLLVRGGESSVLVDPWFLQGHPDYRAQPLQASQLPPVDAIFLTHEHWDHVNDATLLRYPADVPVFVPKQGSDAQLHPRYREYLEMFGIGQVIELAHWEQHALPSGLVVTAIPFRGEGTAEECAVRNCYLFERSNKRIFVHVDSSIDSHGESDAGRSCTSPMRYFRTWPPCFSVRTPGGFSTLSKTAIARRVSSPSLRARHNVPNWCFIPKAVQSGMTTAPISCVSTMKTRHLALTTFGTSLNRLSPPFHVRSACRPRTTGSASKLRA